MQSEKNVVLWGVNYIPCVQGNGQRAVFAVLLPCFANDPLRKTSSCSTNPISLLMLLVVRKEELDASRIPEFRPYEKKYVIQRKGIDC
jgi:hypothetical protein